MKQAKLFLSLAVGLAMAFAGPAAGAAQKVRPQIVFDHKYEQKYNCKIRLETLRLLAPLLTRELKSELAEYYVAISKAIEDAYNSSAGAAGEIPVCAKGITSVLTIKEGGLMDIKMNLPNAWLTLHNVTVKDIRKVFEKYLA